MTPHLIDPKDLRCHVLQDGNHQVSILSLGCITQNWLVSHRGQDVPVVLGYQDPLHYIGQSESFGAIVGRVANRISRASFTLNGQHHHLPANIKPDHLHSGPTGLGHQNWDMEGDDKSVCLTYHSPDGEGGYPAAVNFEVVISLSENQLTYDMKASVDRPTPINLAQHNYYNLMCGAGLIWDHDLQINANGTTTLDNNLIPTGVIDSIADTSLDFRKIRNLCEADPSKTGSDANLVLTQNEIVNATLTAPNGLSLRLITDQPGLQLYTGSSLYEQNPPLIGQKHAPFHGVCLEAQQFPDAVNRTEFPSIIVTPDKSYRQVTTVKIA